MPYTSISGEFMNKRIDGVRASADAALTAPSIQVNGPYGVVHIEGAGNAHDYATMKARELNAFFTLVSGDGQEQFAALSDSLQNSLLWMAAQSAAQLEELMSKVKFSDLQARQ